MVFSFTIPFVASRKSGVHSYHTVPALDEETLLGSPDSKETHNRKSNKHIFFDPSFWLTAFAAISIAVTIRNLLVIQLYSQESYVDYLEASVARPYNGLEKIPRNESSPSWPLSSTHYPDFIGATEGTHVHHALNNGSVVRLDPEVCISIVTKVRSTHSCPPLPYSARSLCSTAFVTTASSNAPSKWSFPVRLENSTSTPHGNMDILERIHTLLCGA